MLRGGFIRQLGSGLYSWMPIGVRVLRKIENIVREEMDAIGGQEILFPALLPRAPYETTNRWTEYGDGVFRLKDRRDNDYLLGPTHEELFTLTVKGEYSSYKDFPTLLFQIQTKYRDEARPRAGILRGREFIMKDSYSFDVDDAGLERDDVVAVVPLLALGRDRVEARVDRRIVRPDRDLTSSITPRVNDRDHALRTEAVGQSYDLLDRMRSTGILYDADAHGEFFHLFTPTVGGDLFFEVVQRVGGYEGYGEVNSAVRLSAQLRANQT